MVLHLIHESVFYFSEIYFITVFLFMFTLPKEPYPPAVRSEAFMEAEVNNILSGCQTYQLAKHDRRFRSKNLMSDMRS
jgi:hypothetical protein